MTSINYFFYLGTLNKQNKKRRKIRCETSNVTWGFLDVLGRDLFFVTCWNLGVLIWVVGSHPVRNMMAQFSRRANENWWTIRSDFAYHMIAQFLEKDSLSILKINEPPLFALLFTYSWFPICHPSLFGDFTYWPRKLIYASKHGLSPWHDSVLATGKGSPSLFSLSFVFKNSLTDLSVVGWTNMLTKAIPFIQC